MASLNVYWEDELIGKHTSGGKNLVFVPNLQVFVFNNKDHIHFDDVSRGGNGEFFCAKSGNTEWRQVKGVSNKQDLEKFLSVLKPGERRSMLKYNLNRTCYNLVVSRVKKLLNMKHIFQYHYDPIHRDKELYYGLTKTCKTGYSFNNCNPNAIYQYVRQADVNSFYSFIMRNCAMPLAFSKLKKDAILTENDFKSYSWFGLIELKIKNYDEFLHRNEFMFANFKGDRNIVWAWINDIDFDFIDKLCGIDDWAYDPDHFWWVKTDFLEKQYPSITRFIDICYSQKELNNTDRFIWKNALERIYGLCIKQKYYKKKFVWNENEQELSAIELPDCDFETLDFRGYFDYAWGVWTTSYARLLLLQKKLELEAAGCNVLYGDVDSLKYQDSGSFELNWGTELGRWKDEGTLMTFKVLSKKWYAGELKNGELKIACSGANKDVVEQFIRDKGLEALKSTTIFPSGYNPFFKYVLDKNNKFVKTYCGSLCLKNASVPNLRISACAGAGKTTRLIQETKKLLLETDDNIVLVAFTRKMAQELKDRIKTQSNRLTICTVDSLVYQLTEGCYGDKFDAALKAANELLMSSMPEAKLIIKNNFGDAAHILVDEAQDLTTERINFLLALPAKSRIFVGDPNQTIFKYDGTTSIFDIDLPNTTDETMNINYRCPQNINDFAESFLPETMRPHAKCTQKIDGTLCYLDNLTPDIVKEYDIALCRTNDEVNFIKDHYPFIKVSTIHSAKGLQFNKVLVIGVNKPTGSLEEQCVSYVMATRAIEKLAIYNAYLEGLNE